ncbi:MAG: hydroxyacid dehydrogenase [Pseudomonadota bacterium]
MADKIVISEFLDEAALAAFGAGERVLYDPGLVDDPNALRSAVLDADALIVRNRTRVDPSLLAAAPALRVVGRLGVGLENIDLAACAQRGITVWPATGANTQSVVEYVIGAMLALRRGVFAATAEVASGAWPRAALGQGGEVSGLTLGLVGYGAIARAVADVARALGMTIVAHDPYLSKTDPAWSGARSETFERLLSVADVLSLHVPLTDSTAGLLGPDALLQMKPGALLINTARGGIVDAPALVDALITGHLGGAALDVFETEPLSGPAAARFSACPNLILTPHIAGVTREANARVSQMTVENVCAALRKARSANREE